MKQHPEYHPDAFPKWKEIQVRYRDLDTLRHVNNAIFSTYFEEARIHFLHSFDRLAADFGHSKSFVLVHIEIDYIGQVHYPSKLIIGSRLDKTGNTSVHTFQAAFDEKTKELKAVCRSVLVWYDVAKQRPARLPELDI